MDNAVTTAVPVTEPDLAYAAIAVRRGQDAALGAVLRDRYGLDLPAAGRWTEAGGMRLAWSGPGNFTAIRPASPDGAADGGTEWVEALAAALDGVAGVIDLADARITIRIAGPGARDVLARLLPLDLHPRAWGPGRCANTVAAHIGVQLLQGNDAPSFDLSAPRSYAGSLRHAVQGAMGQ